ncbi:cytochrome P450 83B1 [Cajanus cajan]|uniref:Cytochrome P450 83B1 n=1 Tax=Cajanus cajan TaxID=3821 RepID=A0A151SWK4_CAJCA|nr:cytochrome P450 83B1 [Cajanus cajan]KYP59170.1 Cytochrome P450 83B1 [Cajanus cajan]
MVRLVYIVLVLVLPVLTLTLLNKHRTAKNRRPPGPRGLPMIGNLHQLDTSNLNFQLWQFSKRHGPLFSLQLGFKRAIVVSSPKLAKELLKDHDLDVCARPTSLGSLKLSYNALELVVCPYSDHWRELRKLCVVNFFGSKPISTFSHVRKSEVKQMIEVISGHVGSSKTTNLSEVIVSVSSAIICRVAFGRKYDEEGAARSRFHWLLNETQAMFISFSVKPNEEKNKDVVDVLLELKKEGHLSIDLTHDQIKAIILDILVGGTDTTAATCVWVMTGLMKNPRAMAKAQEEIRNVCGNKEFIEEEDVEKLVYLKAVLKETLRYYAPTPLLPREAIRSFTIDGYEIEAKTIVYVNGWAIQRDPEAWKDPEEFYPERFLNNEIDFKGQDFELLPFGAGRRICPGMSLGMVTVELITANLLNSFQWEMPVGMKPEHIDSQGLPGLARHKKNHLCLVAKKRV